MGQRIQDSVSHDPTFGAMIVVRQSIQTKYKTHGRFQIEIWTLLC